jgi:hypothetical protein
MIKMSLLSDYVKCIFTYLFLQVRQYQQDLNFKSVAWERLQTETSITGKGQYRHHIETRAGHSCFFRAFALARSDVDDCQQDPAASTPPCFLDLAPDNYFFFWGG